MASAFLPPLLPRCPFTPQPPTLTRRRPSLRRPPSASLDYATSGVDISAESASVRALISALGTGGSPRTPGTRGASVPHAGGFSGLIEFGPHHLALATDGVGSKLLLAEELGVYDTVAVDCMAMNVNDLLCVGAEPLAFVDYIATPKPDPDTWAALGRSLAVACKKANVTLAGGETASLPDLVRGLDLSGTALGSVERGREIGGENVRRGDVLIGLPSDGVHSNGYSLARSILKKAGARLEEPAPFDLGPGDAGRIWRRDGARGGQPTMGEVLLTPTRIYVDPLVPLLASMRNGDGPAPYEALHGMAHITGGGLSNLLRLKKGVGFDVSDPMEIWPEFAWMQREGGVSDLEMHKVFNMGMGMCLVVDADHAQSVTDWLASRMAGTKIVGEVNDSGRVTHKNPSVIFEEY